MYNLFSIVTTCEGTSIRVTVSIYSDLGTSFIGLIKEYTQVNTQFILQWRILVCLHYIKVRKYPYTTVSWLRDFLRQTSLKITTINIACSHSSKKFMTLLAWTLVKYDKYQSIKDAVVSNIINHNLLWNNKSLC